MESALLSWATFPTYVLPSFALSVLGSFEITEHLGHRHPVVVFTSTISASIAIFAIDVSMHPR